MFPQSNRKTGLLSSLAWPASPTGLFCVLALTAGIGLGRFTESLLGGGMGGLSAAGIVVLVVLLGAYLARYLLVAIENTAEGYDVAPPPPDPREAEEVFGAALKLLSLLFFCFLPMLLLGIFSVDLGPLMYVFIGVGALYFPMGMLAMAVTGDLTRSFPGSVLPAILAAPVRYLSGALVCMLAGFLYYLAMAGSLSDLPLFMKVGVDAGASWLLIASLTRMGVIYREETSLQTLLPFPEPEQISSDAVVPPRPMTEIEKILAERDSRE